MVERLTAGQYFGRVAARAVADIGLAEAVYAPGTRLRPHVHERDHFTLVVNGHYDETVAGQYRRCKPADVLFLPREVVHEERHDTVGRHFMIDVPPAARERLACGGAVDRARLIESPDARRIMRRLRGEFLYGDWHSALVLDGLTLLLLAELEGDTRRESTGRALPAFVRKAEEFIRASFTTGISLADVATAVGVDPRRLAIGFRQWKRCSVGDYVRSLQVDLACHLLETTEEPIATVAQAAGFCDHSHCCRVFKQLLGVSPQQVRAGFAGRPTTFHISSSAL